MIIHFWGKVTSASCSSALQWYTSRSMAGILGGKLIFRSKTTSVRFLQKLSTSHLNSSKLKNSGVESSGNSLQHEIFTPFFKYPYIRGVRLMVRMKLYQTALTVIFIPPIAYQYSLGAVTPDVMMAVVGVSGFAGVMLYTMSTLFRRFVGILSLNETSSFIRISHLTFWGNREDIVYPVEQVVPLSELPDNPRDAFVRLKLYDTDEVYYYIIRHGGVLDYKKFELVFGLMSLK